MNGATVGLKTAEPKRSGETSISLKACVQAAVKKSREAEEKRAHRLANCNHDFEWYSQEKVGAVCACRKCGLKK